MYTMRQAPYYSLPSQHVIITVSIFATPWCWQPLAPTGTIATALPNPSAKTSSRGLRQRCLRLVWADSCGGVRNSIVLNLVRILPFYFSAAPPLPPFCPACVDCQRAPTPSHFPSPLSSLWQRHHHIALASPLPVWCHAIIPLLLPCQHHLCICTTATTATIPLSPCHCHQHTSLALCASSLAVLAAADTNFVIVTHWLQQRWCQCHRCMFFCHRHFPTPLLQSQTATQCHIPTPPHRRHLLMPPPRRRHLPTPFMLIVVCWYFSWKHQAALDSALWPQI
jgi:hypothetical protein